MADYVNPKLPNRVIVVTKGCDRSVSIRRRDPVTSAEVNWDAAVYILVDVDKTTPTQVNGVVSGALATIRMESTLLDAVRTGTTWRVVMSSGTPSYEAAVMVGTFERNDGR